MTVADPVKILVKADDARRDEHLRADWAHAPMVSEVERRQYEFEGGGAPGERKPRKRPGWFARLFR